jgi:hypothetical protein
MKIVKQKQSLTVRNVDVEQKKICRHGKLLPSTIRCIICGPSNCGKTNVMFALLCDPNGLRFENVYVYSKSLHQPKYQHLEKILRSIKGMGYHPFEENAEIVEPSKAEKNSIFVFDDVACDDQDNIRAYFSMGRHSCVDCFYLCQTYTRIPKHLLRDNANLLVLFKQDDLNLRHVYNDHVNTDMAFEKFRDLCSECWKDKYGFLVISKDHNMNDGRYRLGFDRYIYMDK